MSRICNLKFSSSYKKKAKRNRKINFDTTFYLIQDIPNAVEHTAVATFFVHLPHVVSGFRYGQLRCELCGTVLCYLLYLRKFSVAPRALAGVCSGSIHPSIQFTKVLRVLR